MKVILKFLQTYEAELFSHLIINEDWRNDAEKSALHPRNNYILEYIQKEI